MKRVGIIFLQLLVTGACLFYVFHNSRTRHQAIAALLHSDWVWLVVGWCYYAVVELLATVRWQILLRIQGITLGWIRAWAIVILGLFLNLFLPGLIGGDVARLYIVFHQCPEKKTRAALSIVMDRLIGLISILFLATAAVWFRFDWLARFPETKHICYLALIILGVGAAGIALLFFLAAFGEADRLPTRLPFRKLIGQGTDALNLYRARLPWIGVAVALTVAAHLAYYLCYYSVMRSLVADGAHVPDILDFFTVMPLVNAITGIPISFGGAGVRETLFQTLFGLLTGTPKAVAAFAASLGFLIQATWGLIGAAIYWTMRPTRR